MTPSLESLLSNPDSAPFWRAVQEERLVLQRCARCRAWRYYPRQVCPHCLAAEYQWEEAEGRGEVYSITTVHRAPAGFDLPAPYQVALVDLVAGVRVLGTVDPGSVLRIGDPVRVHFRQTSTGVRLPVFARES